MSEKCDVRKCKWKTLRTSILNPHFLEQSATSSSKEFCSLSITFLPRYHETTWKKQNDKNTQRFLWIDSCACRKVPRMNMQFGSAISHFAVHIFCFLFMIEFSLEKKVSPSRHAIWRYCVSFEERNITICIGARNSILTRSSLYYSSMRSVCKRKNILINVIQHFLQWQLTVSMKQPIHHDP